MIKEPPASAALTALGITHQVFRHAGPVTTLEQAAEERGQSPKQVVRSIVFRLAEDEFMMVLVAGRGQISWKRLRQHTGRTRLTMATPEDVLRVTGFEIGTVSPFGLRQPLPILIDRRILDEETVSVGSGEAGVGLILPSSALRSALPEAEIANLQE
ncbi:MAG TPA: YbaK/EbsC family protein [Anaerolineales bacterium]